MTLYTTNHKQVLRRGEHFADACDPGAAVLIADALNMRGVTEEPVNIYRGTRKINPKLAERLNGCRAYRVGDQMLCPCGRQWDVGDPPACSQPNEPS